jgi:Cu(I)/Ag(I) efflux system periplasmic protein CusF
MLPIGHTQEDRLSGDENGMEQDPVSSGPGLARVYFLIWLADFSIIANLIATEYIFNFAKEIPMKTRNSILFSLSLVAALSSFPATADNMKMDMPMDSKAETQTHQGKGKVNSVDAKAGRINLTHEAIQSLGWPGMTMDFEVQDKAKLTSIKAGQTVNFQLIEPRKGKYLIIEISVAK